MKVENLTSGSRIYTSNVYLVTGTWNTMDDVNTLVDVGRDPQIVDKILSASTGVGKKRIEQVVLTHSHYDHTSMLPEIRKEFNPRVYAYSRYLEGVDEILKNGDHLRMGDRIFEVIYMSGHSNDSVCFFCEEDGILFAGDAPLVINSAGGTHEEGFIRSLGYLCRKDVRTIYFGHGEPLFKGCRDRLEISLRYAGMSTIRSEGA